MVKVERGSRTAVGSWWERSLFKMETSKVTTPDCWGCVLVNAPLPPAPPLYPLLDPPPPPLAFTSLGNRWSCWRGPRCHWRKWDQVLEEGEKKKNRRWNKETSHTLFPPLTNRKMPARHEVQSVMLPRCWITDGAPQQITAAGRKY